MSCELKIKNNNITVSRFPKLWDQLRNSVSNIEDAVSLYTHAVSEEYIKLSQGNPTVRRVKIYADLVNEKNGRKPLTKKEFRFLIDLAINRDSITTDYLDSFTNDDGIFEMDESRILNHFSQSQSKYFFENANLVQSVYYKLRGKNVDHLKTSYDVVTGFGNPDYGLEYLEQNFSGLKLEEEVIERAKRLDYSISEEEITYILENLSAKIKVPQFNSDGSRKVYNRTEDIIAHTFKVGQDSRKVLGTIDTLLSVTPITWVEDSDIVKDILQELEEDSQELGLDLSGMSDLYEVRDMEDVSNFLESLERFLTLTQNGKVTQEDLEDFSKANDLFFDEFTFEKDAVVDEEFDGSFRLDTLLGEEQVFEKYSSIKIKDGLYKKVPHLDLEEILDYIYSSGSLSEFSELEDSMANKADIKKDILEILKDRALELQTPISNFENLIKIEGLKVVYKVSTFNEIKNVIPIKSDLTSLESEIYKEMLENPELFDILAFSAQGIELLTDGPYSIGILQKELSNFDKLKEYASIKQTFSLQPLLDSDLMSKRDKLVNNPHLLKEFKGDYKSPTDSAIVTHNDSSLFIKVQGEVYEKISDNYYEKLAPYSNGITHGIQSPSVNLENIEDYLLSTDLKVETTKGRLEELSCTI